MGLLFGRVCEIEFGPAGGIGKRFTDLDIQFTIKKGRTSGNSQNYSDITIYNLNKDSIAILNQRDSVVRLYAGYRENGGASLIFSGNPIPNGVRTEHPNQDRVTRIEAIDGYYALSSARVHLSINTNVTQANLFDLLATEVGIPKDVVDFPPEAFVISDTYGYSLDSPSVVPALNDIAASTGTDWWIDNGKLKIVRKGRPSHPDVLVINAEQGNLVGSPLIGSATKSNDGTEIVAQLDPTIAPGRLVSVSSEQVKGIFIVERVEHTGDSRSGSWYSKILGIPYNTGNIATIKRPTPGGESSGRGTHHGR